MSRTSSSEDPGDERQQEQVDELKAVHDHADWIGVNHLPTWQTKA